MNILTMVAGLFVILYGLYTFALRYKDPGKFRKLEAMKERFGDRAGRALHFVAYTVLPIVLGVVLLTKGYQGVVLLGR